MSNAMLGLQLRDPVGYAALPVTVTTRTMGESVGEAFERVGQYLNSRGIRPSGPGLIRYRQLNMEGPLVIEVGWVVPEDTWIDAPFVAEVLPGGRYAVASYSGPFADLVEVTTETLIWADLEGLTFDVTPAQGGEYWASRVEFYLEDPRVGPAGLEGQVEVCILTLD
jgi:effector-binding domain-containing protein